MNSIDRKDLKYFATSSITDIFSYFNSDEKGLDENRVKENQEKFGKNNLNKTNSDSYSEYFKRAFLNPFSIILFCLGLISLVTEIFFSYYRQRNIFSLFIIFTMLLLSGISRMAQEMVSKKRADSLVRNAQKKVTVLRNGKWTDIDASELSAGDIVKLSMGDKAFADIRIINSNDLNVSQSVITGESLIIEKNADTLKEEPENLNGYKNIIFSSTTITSGNATGVVVATGNSTVYGTYDVYDNDRRRRFDKGANSIALVLIRYMIIIVPIVFIASGISQSDWSDAFIFAVSIAVGLTPELLPLVVNACLAKGSYSMNHKQTIVKNINAMQGFGSMNVLCVDKTGTLTGDEIILEYYMDIFGNECQKTLDYAYLASYYQKEEINHIDSAILKVSIQFNKKEYYSQLTESCRLIDHKSFDYDRRLGGVTLTRKDGEINIIKGGIDEVLHRCKYIEYKGSVISIEDDAYNNVHVVTDEMLEDGMKVIAVAYKYNNTADDAYILLGYLAFFDAPKKSAISALNKLKELNVKVKVLSGDNILVTKSICRRLSISTDEFYTGKQLEEMSYIKLNDVVDTCDVFAELSPKQKALIIDTLQKKGLCVGYLGDGLNDLPAMLQADVGISVENAVEAVKESANVILLKKDLNILEEGILEGRKAFANMSKYIKITASSNFGNICAIVVASVLLPFFPMTSIQLLILNVLYDVLCLVLPLDNVDDDLINMPLEWSGKTLGGFMRFFGPISSLFDILTFLFLIFVLCPSVCGGSFNTISSVSQERFVALFQTGWFLESLWTQVFIIQLLRTRKIPFIQSKPGLPVVVVTIAGIFLLSLLPSTFFGKMIGLTVMPFGYYLYLIITVVVYLLTVSYAKTIYVKKHKKLI